jgi:hypothetical protein
MIQHEVPSDKATRTGRVLKFPRRQAASRQSTSSPVEDLAKYAQSREVDDYRHRMMVNAAAFIFVLALMVAGLWLADSLAKLRRNQDCVLAGHRNCAPIKVGK